MADMSDFYKQTTSGPPEPNPVVEKLQEILDELSALRTEVERITDHLVQGPS